jgi:hypothetical protein
VVVLAPLPGLELEHGRVDLGDGMSLVGGEAIDAPPEAVWADPRERGGQRYVLVVLERDIRTDMPLPTSEAHSRFGRLLTALRLFKSGAVALGPLAWSRADHGAWQPMQLGLAGHLRGEPWLLTGEDEPELLELMDLLSQARPGGAIAWGLGRFEMGCERRLDTEALSDYLLALRALLDGSDDTGRASLGLRLAALCAEESDRRALQRRVELAFALERFVVGGGNGDAYMDTIGSESPRDLVLEVEDQLRALLRDVLCGFLDSDLKSAADDILLRSAEPFEIEARDTRRARRFAPEEPAEPAPSAVRGPQSAEEVARDVDALRVRRYWPEAGPYEPVATEPAPAPPQPEPQEDLPDGVTPSDDWGIDEDPDSYSAPV